MKSLQDLILEKLQDLPVVVTPKSLAKHGHKPKSGIALALEQVQAMIKSGAARKQLNVAIASVHPTKPFVSYGKEGKI